MRLKNPQPLICSYCKPMPQEQVYSTGHCGVMGEPPR